jgi:hypothetical protein
MRRGVWIVVIVVAVAIGALVLVVTFTDLDDETRTEAFQEVTELVFDLQNSPVTLIGGATETVEMTVTTGLLDGDVTVERDGDGLRLAQTCPLIIGWGCRAFISIKMPSDVEVSGSTSNGFITAESLDQPVSLTNSNGLINVVDLSGSVVLRTSNGDLLALEMSSRMVDASTSNGRLQLEFAAAPRSVQASSSNGAIDVFLPDDAPAYAVDASTSNGEVFADVRTDPSAADSIVLETSNGDITVRYRE